MILNNKRNILLLTLIMIFLISTVACTYGPQGVFSGIERERAIESVATGLPSTLGPSLFASTPDIEALAGPALYIRDKGEEVWEQHTIESENEIVFGLGATGTTLFAAVLTETGEKLLMHTDTSESITWTKTELPNDEIISGIISINSQAFSWTNEKFYTLSNSGAATIQEITGVTGRLNNVSGAYNSNSDEYMFITPLTVFRGTIGALTIDATFPGVTSGEGYEAGDYLQIIEYVGSDTYLLGTHKGRLFLYDGSSWHEPKSSSNENILTWPSADSNAFYLSPTLTSSLYDPQFNDKHVYLGTVEGYDLLEIDLVGKTLTYKDASNLTEISNQNSTSFSSTPVNAIHSVEHPYNTAYVMYVLTSNNGVWAATLENGYLEWQWLVKD